MAAYASPSNETISTLATPNASLATPNATLVNATTLLDAAVNTTVFATNASLLRFVNASVAEVKEDMTKSGLIPEYRFDGNVTTPSVNESLGNVSVGLTSTVGSNVTPIGANISALI